MQIDKAVRDSVLKLCDQHGIKSFVFVYMMRDDLNAKIAGLAGDVLGLGSDEDNHEMCEKFIGEYRQWLMDTMDKYYPVSSKET